jgi:hypothetical protein
MVLYRKGLSGVPLRWPSASKESEDCFAEFILSPIEGLLRNKMRSDDFSRPPASPATKVATPTAPSFLALAEHPALWATRNDTVFFMLLTFCPIVLTDTDAACCRRYAA